MASDMVERCTAAFYDVIMDFGWACEADEADRVVQAILTASRSSNDEIVEVLEPLANADIDVSGTAAIGVTASDILRAQALLSKVKEQG